jgi:L-malate glycosyltransferase
MRRILITSNMYPSKEKAYAGIFVKNQYSFLKKSDSGNTYMVLALERSFTGFLGSIKKYATFYIKSFQFNFKNKFHIIHLHYFYPLAFIPWFFKKLNGSKIIVTVHGSDLYEKMNQPLTKKLYTFFLKDFDHIICVGNKLKLDFEEKLKIKVSEVLCAGIDKEVFFPLNCKKEYDFIYVGSLIERKGFDIVLQIIERTLKNGARWCVVGSGVYEDEIKTIAAKNPQYVEYVKNVDQKQLNILYNKAKWFFFPSRNEPFGLVATEAVFAGTPIICSRQGGLVEQINEGVNGYGINDLSNINDIENLLLSALNTNQQKYLELVNNCKYSNNQFSLQHVCNRLINIYESL